MDLESGFSLDVVDSALRFLPVLLLQFLWESGWRTAQLLEAGFDDRRGAVQLVQQLDGCHEQPSVTKAWVDALMGWKTTQAGHIRRLRARTVNATIDEQVQVLKRFEQGHAPKLAVQIVSTALTLFQGVHWKTKRSRDKAAVETSDSRVVVEERERLRWISFIIGVLKSARVPVWTQAQLASDPESAMVSVVGKRRARTLRTRYRTWRRVRVWLQCVFQIEWPQHVGHMLDFLRDLEGEHCPRSLPDSIGAALSFFEGISGIPQPLQICQHVLWKNNLADCVRRLQSRSGGTTVHKAPMFCISMILSLELFVVSGQPLYLRFLGFCKLLKLWLTLRWDDLQSGLSPARVSLGKFGMRGILTQTKTTGPGKRILEVPVYLHRQASWSGVDWLAEGFAILQSEQFAFARDYFMPRPGKDWNCCVRKPLTYGHAAGLSRKLLGSLTCVERCELTGDWTETAQALLPGCLPLYWTEHSERNFVPSVAAAEEIPKDDRDVAGRWGISSKQSGEYVRTARAIVLRVQESILKSISGVTVCKYDEDELFTELWNWVRVREPSTEDQHLRYIQALAIDKEVVENCCLHQAWPVQRSGETQEAPLVIPGQTTEGDKDLLNPSGDSDEVTVPGPFDVYWASISKSGFRRLHKIGGCTTNRLECDRWELLTIKQAKERKSDKPCLRCWPDLKMQGFESSGSDSSEDSESSSSEDTEAETLDHAPQT